eukprot:TRINITY_DN23814_c0_g1_i2.p1 TRINITY_DN23814_c0_g1~~TRINITY_DN23814_c0_g1_i2.p1  ORF type:complete len:173 (-),score=48.00 TRINITY_DN23814_c0_g1_i2:23-541(-)
MIRRPPRSTQGVSSAASDVYKRQVVSTQSTWEVNKDGVIEKAVFKTFGCVAAIASSSYVTDILHGKNLEEATQIKNQDISSHLKLPPVKMHCSLLAEQAIKAAIKDYKSKQGKSGADSIDIQKETERIKKNIEEKAEEVTLQPINFMGFKSCLLYTSPSPRDLSTSRMPSSA